MATSGRRIHYNYLKAEERLAAEQHKPSHMVKGSNNWVKLKKRPFIPRSETMGFPAAPSSLPPL